MFLSLWNLHFDQFLFQKLYYLNDPIHFLFTSCSCPFHSYLYFLFIAYSFLFMLVHFFSFPIYFLFIAYSFSFHSFVFFIAFDLRNLPKFPKAMFFYQFLIQKLFISSPKSIGIFISCSFYFLPFPEFFKKVIYRGGSKYSLGPGWLTLFLFMSYWFPIQVLFMSYLILIHFLFISCSF